jgi:hypothetical protein
LKRGIRGNWILKTKQEKSAKLLFYATTDRVNPSYARVYSVNNKVFLARIILALLQGRGFK